MFFMFNILLLLFTPVKNYAGINMFQTTLVKKIISKSGLDYNHLLGQIKIKKNNMHLKNSICDKSNFKLVPAELFQESFLGTCRRQVVY